MITNVKREKPKMRWLYFVAKDGAGAAKMYTDAPEGLILVLDYRRCSYRRFVQVARSLRKSERKELESCLV